MGKFPNLLQNYWLLPCLLLAGYGGNYFKLHIFFGVDFLFGSIATLLVLVYYGLPWGLVSAAIAGSHTLIIWRHGYGVLIIMLEALVVGLMLRRRQTNLVLINSLFWLLIGMPLVYIFYRWGLDMTPVTTGLITLKQAANGIFNSLIASFLITGFGLPKQNLSPLKGPAFFAWKKISFEQTLFNLLVAFIFFPLLFITVFNGQEAFLQMEKQTVQELTALSIPIKNSVEDWYQIHLEGAEVFATKISPLVAEINQGNGAQLPALNLMTQTMQTAFAGFSNIYVGDRQGKIIASSPELNEVGESRLGLIQAEKMTGFSSPPKIQISPLHRTNVNINPHIAITIPLVVKNSLEGFVNASLNLAKTKELLYADRVTKELNITLINGQNQVIASTIDDLLPLEFYQPFQGGNPRDLNPSTYHWYPDKPANPTLRWRNSYYYHILSLDKINDWQLVIGLPARQSIEKLQIQSVQKLGLLLFLSLVGLVIAISVSKRVANPLLTLAKITTDIPAKLQYQGLTPIALHSEVSEVITLNENFNEMLITLQNQFKTIKQARDNLEVRVAERTNTLIMINKQLAGEIEERQRIEVKLREAKENAELASGIKSEFLANISHEIRTPMNAILGFCDLLLQKDLSLSQTKNYLNAIGSSSKVLLALIDDILDISKIEAGKLVINLEPVDLRTIVREIKQIFDYKAESKGLLLTIQVDETLSQAIYFDAVRLRQILFNLVGNALKFTEEGQVFIYIGVEDIRSRSQGTYISLAIEVTDTGIGIAPEDQARIFDVFTQSQGQSTRKYGGTGLGLTITKRLTSLLGGEISLFSRPGEGSTFILRFPAVRLVENLPESGLSPGHGVHFDGHLGAIASNNATERFLSARAGDMAPKDKRSINQSGSGQYSPMAVPLMDQARRQQLISLLAQEETNVWSTLRHTLVSRQLRNFGDRLASWGTEYGWDDLEAYGQGIIQALEDFDSRRLEQLMGQFPQYRASLTEIAAGVDSRHTAE
ncbi:histidine kinase [Synechocystis sp. LEGE 06083]|uniref:sensor histidine kinase n=1 Tax=Synechocystis sp. LEGE 06083 TaxID=915336 RepID=UPI00187EF9BD|nr:hybrid sensor histidine kinase/response regulator [Synechocystis sp. LEGE 06083]MBE9196271.1 histidine kinase [Synechocystis sp. LEGE 06083]